MKVNTGSIRFKIVTLIVAVGAVLSFLLAVVAPKQAENLGERILEKDVEFIATQVVANLALGMQTMILDDGAALDQTLDAVRHDGEGAPIIANVWVFDEEQTLVHSLNKSNIISDLELSAKLTITERDNILRASAPMRDSDGSIVGYALIDFSKEYLQRQASSNSMFSLLIALAVIVCTIVLGSLLGAHIGKPVTHIAKIAGEMTEEFEQFSEVVDSIANNDLTHELSKSKITALDLNSAGEIGDLVKAINGALSAKEKMAVSLSTMSVNLTGMVGHLRDNSHALSSSSTELSASAEHMATGAQQQTGQAQQVSTAVEEMTAAVIETSKNAAEASDVATKASEIADTGSEVVTQTISGIQRISEVVQSSAGTINNLAKSAEQIGEIIGVIDDIADQTNLLALNAAIEAARAGEQGRGFAVVADEVRKLAERTTKATSEISTMIKGIQSETSDAVRSIEDGAKEVSLGRELADKAGESLGEILNMNQRVMNMIHHIATAAEEQSTSAEEISRNVEQISNVTQDTARGANQSRHEAERLNKQSENLASLVAKFKISQQHQE
jgi:methyl-accepting chemotaxis protein